MALLRRADVCVELAISLSTLDRIRRRGPFPEPVKLSGTSCPRWWSEDIRAWARERAKEQAVPLQRVS